MVSPERLGEETVAMLSARELSELAEIAEQLQRSDRVLAGRLRRHRIRLRGLRVTHPITATLLLWFGMVAVAVVGLGLLAAGLTTHGWAPVVTGTVALALVPFTPVLFTVWWRTRSA